jgi:hypothetical protein
MLICIYVYHLLIRDTLLESLKYYISLMNAIVGGRNMQQGKN